MKEEKERFYKKCVILSKKLKTFQSEKELAESSALANSEVNLFRIVLALLFLVFFTRFSIRK